MHHQFPGTEPVGRGPLGREPVGLVEDGRARESSGAGRVGEELATTNAAESVKFAAKFPERSFVLFEPG